MANHVIDMIGKRCGFLTITESAQSRKGARWRFICDCGNVGEALGVNLRRGKPISCGCQTTSNISYRFSSLQEHFESYISPEPNSGCWIWLGNISKPFDGYGFFMSKKFGIEKGELAHRVSWFIYRGSDPRDSFVLHHCDNPTCVNPDHLFLGDAADNKRDSCLKGRHCFGRRHNFYVHGRYIGEKQNPEYHKRPLAADAKS